MEHSLIRQTRQESYLTGQNQINLSAQGHMLVASNTTQCVCTEKERWKCVTKCGHTVLGAET